MQNLVQLCAVAVLIEGDNVIYTQYKRYSVHTTKRDCFTKNYTGR